MFGSLTPATGLIRDLDAGISNHQFVQGLLTGRMRDGSRFQGMAAIDAFLAGIDFRNAVALLAGINNANIQVDRIVGGHGDVAPLRDLAKIAAAAKSASSN